MGLGLDIGEPLGKCYLDDWVATIGRHEQSWIKSLAALS